MWSLISYFKQRALLWSLQQFLSEGINTKAYLRSALFGVVAASAAGVLIALAIAAGLGALYFYLIEQNVEMPVALAVAGLAALLPALVLLWLAQAILNSLKTVPTKTLPVRHAVGVDHLTDAAGNIINAFIEGVLTRKPQAQNRLLSPPAASVSRLEDRRKISSQT